MNTQGSRLRVDIQAAITVIGRRSQRQRDYETSIRINPQTRSSELRFDLSKCNLAGINAVRLDLSHASFDQSTLIFGLFVNSELGGASFYLCDMQKVRFFEVELSGVNFSNAQLNNGEFDGCTMIRSFFANTDISTCKFQSCNLALAEFYMITPTSVQFVSSQLEGSRFRNCIFSQWLSLSRSGLNDVLFEQCQFQYATTDLKHEQLEAAWGDGATVLPNGLDRPTGDRWLPAGSDESAAARWRERWSSRRSALANELDQLRRRLLARKADVK